jgi:hypothetical protein
MALTRHRPYRPRVRRDPTTIVCAAHGFAFVEFKTGRGYGYMRSHGCPVCVGQAREKVRAEKLRRLGETPDFPADAFT